jgi:hypothetical protein
LAVSGYTTNVSVVVCLHSAIEEMHLLHVLILLPTTAICKLNEGLEKQHCKRQCPLVTAMYHYVGFAILFLKQALQ